MFYSLYWSALVQDYAEGGARSLDIEVFVRSLYLRQVRHLCDPRPQAWRGLGWHFVQREYAHLGMGERILTSTCDFLAVLDAPHVPPWWQSVLVAWGGLLGVGEGWLVRERWWLRVRLGGGEQEGWLV